MPPPSAILRASDCRSVRTTARLAGTPALVKPARMLFFRSVCPISVRARFGKLEVVEEDLHELFARKREHEVVVAAALAPPLPLPPPAPAPSGLGMRSPATYLRLPGSTNSRSPPRPKPKDGSEMSFFGTRTSPPCSMSANRRSPTIFFTAASICALYRRRNRSRLTALLPRPFGRRSMRWCIRGLPAQARPVMTTCARAGTTPPAGAPASRCSPWRPCARRNSGASASRRRTPWR